LKLQIYIPRDTLLIFGSPQFYFLHFKLATSDSEADIEVRFVDQEKINEFGRLNNRLLECKAELKQMKDDMDRLDDASSELMLASAGKVMLLIGEAFIECDEDYATSYCEKKLEV
jgi:prefoldin subunit 4